MKSSGVAFLARMAVAWPLAVAVLLTGVTVPASSEVLLPPADAPWDYQIGGARPVPDGVQVVVRDRREAPAGAYPVCYVNGFQTQPGERATWKRRPGLVLRDDRGRPVVDSGWGEQLLDLRTHAKRTRLARLVESWMAGCARRGFVAVELDNLDSWTRSQGLMRRQHAAAYARLLTAGAHAQGLAVAQKNTASLLGQDLGFDFAVVEDCARWDECRRFADAFDGRAFLVEYRTRRFERACRQVGDVVSVLLRDRQVTPGGPFRTC
ncbi:endo alpha-1,4 polygalactosaminidase [Nocardioides campestrisoli]|uniref:endo alpha-1,4 polygalactosaminidase n=1 Tax=Nocardioides campestrisoli TaxID=2736757 RepID=UPI001CD6B189|nr:endo alpha-1,4 polygalactosaminidase [Nocardioides campestrisoli]